jgi:hypothetical protein
LHLDDAEQQHLAALARAAGPGNRTRRKPPVQQIRPSIARVLELMTEIPAFVGNGRGDVLAANALAQALYAPMFDDATRVEENTAADAIELTPAQLARLDMLRPAAGARHDDANMASIDQ